MIYCIQLDDLDPDEYFQAGAKAANLARLRHMALPVPNGFVITTEACKRFLTIGKLAGSIRQLLHDVEHNHKDITNVAEEISEMVLRQPTAGGTRPGHGRRLSAADTDRK